MSPVEIIQLFAWNIALVELTVGLYILVLNFRSSANRYVSALLGLIAINTFAQGQLLAADNLAQVKIPTLLLAATTPAIQPALLLIALVLLKPRLLNGGRGSVRWILYSVVALPFIFTTLDALFSTSIWYTGFEDPTYTGGFINLSAYTQGALASALRVIYIYTITILTIVPIAYFTFFDKSTLSLTRKLGITLFITQDLAVLINFLPFTAGYLAILITSTIFATGYAYAAFWQLISERQRQRGRLQPRMTALVLTITVPALITIPVILANYPVAPAAAILTVLTGAILIGALTSLAIRQAVQPIQTLTHTAITIANGDLTRVAMIDSEDEIGSLAEAINRMTEQLLEMIGSLEQRVFDRTKDLELRSRQLQAAADVGRAASSILDVNALIQQVVNVIQERFNLYYVGIFFVDELGQYAVLRAGTGLAGQEMMARHHRIQVGQGMIGWCISHAEPRVAREAGEDAVRLATAELPLTRSEAAIPLMARGQIIGAITVQDTQIDTFDSASIAVLQTMADLVSIAISNAQLFSNSQSALEVSQRAYGEMVAKSWDDQLANPFGFRSNSRGVQSLTEVDLRRPGNDSGHTLSIPIKVRGSVVGELITHKPDDSRDWSENEISVLNTLSEQLGVALEAARLYQETQRRAAFEKLTREISSQIRETLSLDTILQTAASEFQRALDLSEVEIRMGFSDTNSPESH
jgi:GAF domain-containing protein/HAMP domain-containing protein